MVFRASIDAGLAGSLDAGVAPLYKWRDDKGRLHVTDQPPPDRPYETVRYDPKTNVVPGRTSP